MKNDRGKLATVLAARDNANQNSSYELLIAKEKQNKFIFRNAAFVDPIKDLVVPDVDDAWAWCDGRGVCGVHPVFEGKNFGKRGLLRLSGTKASLNLKGDMDRNALDGYKQEKEGVKKVGEDFIAEVYAVREGEGFQIYIVDLLYFGDNLTLLGFKERREKLTDFFRQHLVGEGNFSLLEVKWVSGFGELQEATKWALGNKIVTSAIIKSGSGEYPIKAPSSDWYELKKDKQLLEQEVEKGLADHTLLALAALGIKVALRKSAELKKEARIVKADDDEKQFVLGVVLEPMDVDTQEDIMIPADIETTAHDYLAKRRVVGFRHSEKAEAVVVESYIAPVDFVLDGEQVKKGSWLLGIIIEDDELWRQVKDGEINGFSVGGFGRREELK
ncbi:hypothetical protein KAT92_03700 [Candidatus Babeliales bacterium]|nr:hypothetical protein [Candidatus Babeliales bacterium]